MHGCRPLAQFLTAAACAVLFAMVPADGRASASTQSCDNSTDVAIGRPATASSMNAANQSAAKAVDNNSSSKWLSTPSDPQWLQVDLGSSQNVCGVTLTWGNYATAYSVQVSDDGTNWTTLSSTGATGNGAQQLTVSGTGRYVRMYGTTRGDTSKGYGVRTFAIFVIPIPQPPAFTSSTTASFALGTAGSFTVTTTGTPTVKTIAASGALPPGLNFTDNGNGTANIAGTPTAAGASQLSLTASNGLPPDAMQALTVQVITRSPGFTSPATATFRLGNAGSFTVTTTGAPPVSGIGESGALPAGLSFADNGDGTASITGTPTGAVGNYRVTLTATNGIAPDAVQSLNVRILQSVFTVTTTADLATNSGACGDSTIITPPSPLSLREATCLANNIGGSATITIPAGHYTLTNGELQPGKVTGSSVNLVGAGSASTILDGAGQSRVLDLDANIVGGVNNSISGLTITGGATDTFGGAGIIAGSSLSTNSDIVSLDDVVVTGNHANLNSPGAISRPGGGIEFQGGKLTITNSVISNNSSGSSAGSGLFYQALGSASPEKLTISTTTFSGNSVADSSGNSASVNGGALAVLGSATFSVTNSRFVNNTVTAVAGSGSPVGAAIYQESGTLTVTGSTFTGNSVSGASGNPAGGAIFASGGTATLHYNRFTGNRSPTGSAIAAANLIDAGENWWGCSAGPGAAGCDTTTATVTTTPRLVLTATANPSHLVGPNATATITASLTTDSAGNAVAGANLTSAFDGLPVTFADPPGDATVGANPGPQTVSLSAGMASIDYHSNTTTGSDNVPASLDNDTESAAVQVD
jgi:hypothetical protein